MGSSLVDWIESAAGSSGWHGSAARSTLGYSPVLVAGCSWRLGTLREAREKPDRYGDLTRGGL